MKIRVFLSTLLVIVLLSSLLAPLAGALKPMDTDAGPSLDDLRGMYQKGLITPEEYQEAAARMAPASPETVLVDAAREAVLFAEDFETWPPPGWAIVNNSGDCVWDSNTFYVRPNFAGGDGQCADADSDACGVDTAMDTELRSPPIDLSGALPGTFLQFVGAFGGVEDQDSYAEVLVSPDGGANWNQELYWSEDHDLYGPGELVVIDMTPYLGSTEVVISFHYFAPDWGFWFQVDQVRVQSPSPDLSESTKEVWPATAEPGDVLTYTVHILNTGDAPAWQTVMTDVIPTGTAYVTNSVECSWGDCEYDPVDNAIYWHEGDPPDFRYFVANHGNGNRVWEIDLIRAGQFVDGTWGVIDTCKVGGMIDNVGIDYDAEHGVLYHSDLYSANIVVTDLNCNVIGSFSCASPTGFNTGVTYVEGSQPSEVWVTDYESNTTTRCLAELQPGAPVAPAPVTLPDAEGTSLSELNYSGPGLFVPVEPIDQFPNTWAPVAIGLVYDPSRDWVRYVHESDFLGLGNPTVYDVGRPDPYPVLGQCILSVVNPGWPATLNNRDGAGYDFESDTYFLPDYEGDQVFRDDHMIEIDPQCNILNAWETDGVQNDSYDGSAINTIMDIAVVPNPPPFEEFEVTFQVEVIDVPCVDTIVNEAVITDPEAAPVVVQAETLIDCAGPELTVEPSSLHSDQCPDEQMTLELSICNAGDQALEWGITEVPADIPWLSEDPIGGMALPDECQKVDVTFDATDLASGDYDGYLDIVSNDPDTPTATLPVSLTVLEPAAIIAVTAVITDFTVAFDAEVAGSLPITYVWDFGDGFGDVVEDPIHTYADARCYTVTLDITNECGFDDTNRKVCIEEPFFYYYLPMLYKDY